MKMSRGFVILAFFGAWALQSQQEKSIMVPDGDNISQPSVNEYPNMNATTSYQFPEKTSLVANVTEIQDRSSATGLLEKKMLAGDAVEARTFDVIQEFKEHSIVKLGGQMQEIASHFFAAVSIAFLMVLLHQVFMSGSKLGRWNRFRRAIDSLLCVWVALTGICATICCMSVYRSQGLTAMKSGQSHNPVEDYYRPTHEFKYDNYFIPSLVIGSVSFCLIVGTLIIQHLYPPVRRVANDNSASHDERLWELDHARYIFLLAIIIHHFTHKPPTKETGFWHSWFVMILPWSLTGFIMLSGYNSAFSQQQLNSRRLQRIMKVGFSYYWSQALMILYFFYVICPLINSNWEDKEAANDLKWKLTMWHGFGNDDYKLDFKGFLERLFGPPAFVLWYLQSLMAWLLMIPAWMHLRAPIFASIVLALLVLYWSDDLFKGETSFSPTRTLEYFPYFVIGASMKKFKYDQKLRKLAEDPYTTLVCLSLLCANLSFALGTQFSEEEISIYAYPSASMHQKTHDHGWYYIIGRAGYVAFSVPMIFAVVGILPRKQTYFSKAGACSLVPYVLHVYVQLLVLSMGLYGKKFNEEKVPQLSPLRQFELVIIATGCLIFFSNPSISSILKWVIMPPMNWMFDHEAKKGNKNGAGTTAYQTLK
mmetsp:Transcript_39336/g.76367  ORF Transcript_39336/g.76367 Transcript_39336/m.76367 type:complete len:648 (-) Transcript_39336:271-2214(-)